MQRFMLPIVAMILAAFATGCATGPNANPADPLEPMNRAIFKFNDGLDQAILKPVATGYKEVIPSPIRQGVNNFFNNIGDVWSLFNHLLQFKFQNAVETAGRLGINTFLGLGGILDIATEAGLEPPRADLGQTLGKWGVPSGPYLMIPILGPSNVRDGVALVPQYNVDPVSNVDHVATRNTMTVTRAINTRSQLLGASDVVDAVALDRYTFIRDAYSQQRQNLIEPKKKGEDDEDFTKPEPTQEKK
jgi:phospholipid-binding lipoprotein MlaA